MFLALREMRRALVRFGLLMASVGLLVFLILFQQTLQNGLITSFVGRHREPVGAGARLQRGRPPQPAGQRHHPAAGAADPQPSTASAASGRIGQGTFSVTADGELDRAPRSSATTSRGLGSPDTLVAGPPPDGRRRGGGARLVRRRGLRRRRHRHRRARRTRDHRRRARGARSAYQASPTLFTTLRHLRARRCWPATPTPPASLPAVIARGARPTASATPSSSAGSTTPRPTPTRSPGPTPRPRPPAWRRSGSRSR